MHHSSGSTDTLFHYTFDAMGTECSLSLYADDEAIAAASADAAMAEVSRIEYRYSRYREESVLSSINRAARSATPVTVDAETAALLDYAFRAFDTSGGLFDISSGCLQHAWSFDSGKLPAQQEIDRLLPAIGMHQMQWVSPKLSFSRSGIELDLGGIGKEYAVDRAADVLQQQGIRSAMIDLGGDLRILGPHADAEPWHIGIRHPRHPSAAMAVLPLACGALATSGDYERYMEVEGVRYCHILNPHTGWPVQGLSSVTVLAGQCMLAGTLSTIAMLMGHAGKQWLADIGVAHFWVDRDGAYGGTLSDQLEMI
ncbi:FAD:protein FMN transferase [Mariprofundus erugo]|uniref:FAD:protein FMN transferase n=2 Tax=Mariprofundus erugo TaxID=2528639 RepID=A0A5R9GN06_9PROT|nr:FAD:protein FMN transferase [Mariprofundus erugo]